MIRKHVLSALVAVIIGLLLGTSHLQAQEKNGWSAPYRLSTEGITASEAFMLADPYGVVHAFWTESGYDDGRTVIMYARFDGQTWSRPLDVAVSRRGESIGFLSPAIDRWGTLHLIWTGGSTGPVYYASVPSTEAASAKNWSLPRQIAAPAFWVRLVVDSQDRLHIVYSNFSETDPGIYYIRSENGGRTWTDPFWLDPDIPAGQLPFWVQFDIDANDGLHVVWNYLALDAAGKAVRYINSLDGGQTWQLPFTIDEPDESPNELRMAHPGMLVNGESVFVIWGGDEQLHREFRYSTNEGQSWSVTLRMFGNLVGQAAGGGLAMDSLGRLHYATQVRWPKAIWHAVWQNSTWSTPEMVYYISGFDKDPVEKQRIHAHNVRLVVRGGNQLVMTFTNSPGDEQPLTLYAVHKTLDDAPPIDPIPAPAPPTPVPTAAPAADETPALAAIAPKPAATPFSAPGLAENQPSLSNNFTSPTTAIFLGVLPVVLLVAGVIAFQMARRH